MEETTRFLNVDLDITSTSPLDSLVKAFGRRVVTLHVGKERRAYGAHLELAIEAKNPDVLLRRFVAVDPWGAVSVLKSHVERAIIAM